MSAARSHRAEIKKKISTVRATPRYFPAHVSQSDGKRRNLGDEVAKVAAVFSGAWD